MKQIIYIVIAVVMCTTACNEKDDEGQPAQVKTLSVTGITDTEATCWGKIINQGTNGIKEYGIEVSFPGEYHKIAHTTNKADSFGVQLTGLAQGTEYAYMAYAIDDNNQKYYGTEFKFMTMKPANVYVLIDASLLTEYSAIIKFYDTDKLKEWGVYYSTRSTATTTDAKVEAKGNTNLTLTGLLPATQYSVLAYAIDKNGLTTFDEVRSFGTHYGMPATQLNTITSVTTSGATAAFEISAIGGGSISECGIRYSTNGTTWTTKAATYAKGTITYNLTGLTPATLYKVQAYAKNSGDKLSYSETREFTTLGGVPVLAAPTITAPVSYRVNMTGKVANEHLLPVTEYGFCWSSVSGQAVAEGANYVKVSSGSKVTFEHTSYDLLANTKYYVRAYAKNTAGTGYSEEVQVSTPAIVYGEVNDRNTLGKKYKTVVIGKQTWMAENLISGDTETFNVAKIKNLGTEMCPTGWHIPTQAEFKDLITEAGGTNLATKTLRVKNEVYGLGTNATGFSVVPESNLGQSFNNNAYWTSTQAIDVGSGSTGYYHIFMSSNGYDQLGYVSSDSHKFGNNYNYPIRCIKNK